MPGSDDVERKIREMLIEMGDTRLLAEFDGAVKAFDERSRRVDETLEELMQEVDELLLQMDKIDEMDEIDDAAFESEEDPCAR
jgi:hypothetical protein